MTRSRCWIGTWHSFPNDWQTQVRVNTVEAVGQEEVGKETDKRHLQFAVRFKNARTLAQVKLLYPGAHLEPSNNWNACKAYCNKEDTYAGNRLTKPLPCKDPLDGKELRPIQRDILNIVNSEPDDRTVHWFYDPAGGSGKTTLAKHILLHNPDNTFFCGGKSADMKYGIFTHLKKKKLKTVLINLTRTCENYVSYQGIEEIKDGLFYNTKYESDMVLFDSPHVIILANFLPDKTALSEDRWHIHNYTNHKPNKIIEEFMETNNII